MKKIVQSLQRAPVFLLVRFSANQAKPKLVESRHFAYARFR